jgi:hypothetical protein
LAAAAGALRSPSWPKIPRLGKTVAVAANVRHIAQRIDKSRKGAPFRQCGRASLLVNLPGDEMALLIEMVVDLGVN